MKNLITILVSGAAFFFASSLQAQEAKKIEFPQAARSPGQDPPFREAAGAALTNQATLRPELESES